MARQYCIRSAGILRGKTDPRYRAGTWSFNDREKAIEVLTYTAADACWPRHIESRLGRDAPTRLWAIGNLEILAAPKLGLFCSSRSPSSAMSAAQEAAQKLREDGTTVISGFQSPVEKECLRILLGGTQPVIICPARALRTFRLPAEWRQALESGRLLLLSRFEKTRRADKSTARRRNELVAALSDEVLIIHATPGGHVAQLLELVASWHIPQRKVFRRELEDK